MTTPIRVSVVVPAHNEQGVLAQTVGKISERLATLPGSEIIIVENGSTDRTFDVARSLASHGSIGHVRVRVAQARRGLGNALREGIRMAQGDVVLLTAADLPFGFSDLDRALALDPRPRIVIGSKGHPGSIVENSRGRRAMSLGYRVLRKALLGLDVRDTQGTFVIDRRFAEQLLPSLTSEGYFVTTEIVAHAVRVGHRPFEVPIVYARPRSHSHVRPFRDGWETFTAMVDLRERLRKSPRLVTRSDLESVPSGA